MGNNGSGDATLSMIDVITNGLASLLVLLFLLLLIKQQVSWAGKSAQAARATADDDNPLVILVLPEGNEPLFAGANSPWRIDSAGPDVAREHGPRFAAAYFRRAPDEGERVRLLLPPDMPGCRVETFAQGRRLVTRELGREQAGKDVQLWPPAEVAP